MVNKYRNFVLVCSLCLMIVAMSVITTVAIFSAQSKAQRDDIEERLHFLEQDLTACKGQDLEIKRLNGRISNFEIHQKLDKADLWCLLRQVVDRKLPSGFEPRRPFVDGLDDCRSRKSSLNTEKW